MSTLRAVLTGVGGVHRDIPATGPCCLVRKQVCELTPRRVLNALGETMVMRHPVDRQILHRDYIEDVDNPAAVLVGEIAPSPPRAFMHARHHLTPFRALRRTLFFLAEATLHLRQRLFFSAEEARVSDLLPSAEGGERFQADINPNLLPGFWQGRRFRTLTGEADIPLVGAAAADGGRLGRTFQGAMQDDFHQPYAMQPEMTAISIQLAADGDLRVGEAGIASFVAKSRVARFLAGPYAAEERLEGQINAYRDIL